MSAPVHDRTAHTPVERGLGRVITLPPPAPGFIGDGHTAVHVIDPREFALNDPFILLADDRVDIPRGRRRGASARGVRDPDAGRGGRGARPR